MYDLAPTMFGTLVYATEAAVETVGGGRTMTAASSQPVTGRKRRDDDGDGDGAPGSEERSAAVGIYWIFPLLFWENER